MSNSNEFQWTDELVKEFIELEWNNPQSMMQKAIDEFKASKAPSPVIEKNKNWEIVSMWLGDKNSIHPHSIPEHCKERGCAIYSVRRCDGIVFTIGDKLSDGYAITTFRIITEDNFRYSVSARIGQTENIGKIAVAHEIILPNSLLEEISHAPIPQVREVLFTSFDGVDIFEGGRYLKVDDKFSLSIVVNAKNKPDGKSFSTENAAEEYILLNKPCLSVNDVKNFIEKNFLNWHSSHNWDRLQELAKQKIDNNGTK